MKTKCVSSIESLKELLTILGGLTITFSLSIIVADIKSDKQPFDTESVEKYFLFGLLIVNVVRFYHGNMRLLDDIYVDSNMHKSEKRLLWLDFNIILLTSIVFAATGFFIDFPIVYFVCMMVILFLDVLWGIFCVAMHDPGELKIQRIWMINNFVFLIVIIGALFVSSFMTSLKGYAVFAMIVCGYLSAFIDFKASWNFYFPNAKLNPPEQRGGII